MRGEHTGIPGQDRALRDFLLRSWATRASGDEDRRAEVLRQLGSDDVGTDGLMRWMSSMARLRTANLLLRVQSRGA